MRDSDTPVDGPCEGPDEAPSGRPTGPPTAAARRPGPATVAVAADHCGRAADTVEV